MLIPEGRERRLELRQALFQSNQGVAHRGAVPAAHRCFQPIRGVVNRLAAEDADHAPQRVGSPLNTRQGALGDGGAYLRDHRRTIGVLSDTIMRQIEDCLKAVLELP